MYFTGFADEAAKGIDDQIKATQAIGWSCIEARNIDGTNIHDLEDEAFDIVCGKLEDAGVQINCFGSSIANWQKDIRKPIDICLEQSQRAIPRMQRLGTKLLRIMSYPPIRDQGPEDQMEEERFARLRTLVPLFLDAGIQPVHENCMNYGGMGWPYTLRLIENVPGLKLAYDTGNPVFTDDRTQPEPYPKQSSWTFYEHVREHVAYIHIKDGVWEGDKMRYTYPGEGQGDVERVVEDLLRNGYDGGISIEPHLGAVFHEETEDATPEQRKLEMYVEYGRRMEAMVAAIRSRIEA